MERNSTNPNLPETHKKKLDHQLDLANQTILFKMLNHLISQRQTQSFDISACKNFKDLLDKMRLRLNFLNSHINYLNTQLNELEKFKQSVLPDLLSKNRKALLKEIKAYTSEKEDLEMRIPKLEIQHKYVETNCDRLTRYISFTNPICQKMKENNDGMKKEVELVQHQRETDNLTPASLAQDSQQISNFEVFLNFVQGSNTE